MSRLVLAYLDAGSGSVLLQAIAGGAAAIGVVLKLYWSRFKRFLRIGKREEREPPSAAA